MVSLPGIFIIAMLLLTSVVTAVVVGFFVSAMLHFRTGKVSELIEISPHDGKVRRFNLADYWIESMKAKHVIVPSAKKGYSKVFVSNMFSTTEKEVRDDDIIILQSEENSPIIIHGLEGLNLLFEKQYQRAMIDLHNSESGASELRADVQRLEQEKGDAEQKGVSKFVENYHKIQPFAKKTK